ncbi:MULTISPECIES: hypothetical protein [Aquimarina]|uniref:Redoxin domain-containing protein n=1 Tax=Aquimarina algiphila TaxID=2047982 RepID=A0A554VCI6_9FLAO|nr:MULTISPECIES: hypothetical protein [Aquimarina]TSE04394.1 hypothetical protein FOF46_26575 [Aquimarina algiphila]
MSRLLHLLQPVCYVCLLASLIGSTATLSAQQSITPSQIDTLLLSSTQKNKIIHINGGPFGKGREMLSFIDYLNKHKPSHLEITVILVTVNSLRVHHKKLLQWLDERDIHINYYVMHFSDFLESGLYRSIPTTYIVDNQGNMCRFVDITNVHKKNILHHVSKNVPKTIKAIDNIYKHPSK